MKISRRKTWKTHMCEKSGHTLPISESKPQNKPHRERERETQGVGKVGIGRGTLNHQQTTSHLRLTTNGGIKLSNQSRKKILVGTLDLYRTNIYMMDVGVVGRRRVAIYKYTVGGFFLFVPCQQLRTAQTQRGKR